MIGLYEENHRGEEEREERTFFEDDVDDILAKNSRIAKYSVIQGSYSFAKSRFVS